MMPTYRQTFTINGQPYGESLREDQFVHGHAHPPWSRVWFCPVCGEVWARVEIAGSRFHVLTAICEKHPKDYGWMTELPGSLWSGYERDFNDSLPDEVMRREVGLCFKAYDDGIAASLIFFPGDSP